MKIIVGLGNPGFRYRNTRHNAGFQVIKAVASKYGFRIKKKGYGGVYGTGRILDREVMLFEPLTFMNLSGEAVRSVSSNRQCKAGELLVISDDVSLPLGTFRLRRKGSAGGHNGLKSIIEHMGTDFPRLRIGVGPFPGNDVLGAVPGEDMSGYVLSSFPRRTRQLLDETIEKAVRCVEVWLLDGVEKAMSLHNG